MEHLVRVRTIAALALTLLLASCAGIGTCPAPPAPWQFTIVGTSDLQGRLDASPVSPGVYGDVVEEADAVGGISRIATLISKIEDERPGAVAVVSAGDDLSDRYFHAFEGKAIYGLMSDAGYEICALGNHEFDKGPNVLAAALAEADFSVVASDLETAGTPLEGPATPLLVEDYDGLKVGYFSLMTGAYPMLTNGGSVELASTNLETAHRAVRELKAMGAHLVVGLTHIGYANDLELARSVPGIDIIFGGHSREYYPELARMGGTLVVNGGEKATHLVRLDVTVDRYGRMDIEGAEYSLIPVAEDVAPDPVIEAKLQSYSEALPDAAVLGRTDVVWNLTDEALSGGESPAADLMNDHLRTRFGADVVLNNAAAFGGNRLYGPGPITDAMFHEMDESGSYACRLDIGGAHLKEVLEHGAASHGTGGFLQVSGLRYDIDLTSEAQVIDQGDDGDWRVVRPGSRVRNTEVLDASGRWLPLNAERSYSVLSNSSMVKDAAGGYFWLRRHGTNMLNTYTTFSSILAQLAWTREPLNPGEPDGRVTVVR